MASSQPNQERKVIPRKAEGNLQKYGKGGAKMNVVIAQKIQISHDVYQYVFDLPDPTLPLGLLPAQHIFIHAKVPTKKKPQGEQIKRLYSPFSPIDQKGSFILMFKVYRRNVHPKFPEGGPMSQYLESLKVGDSITISGPLAGLYYAGPGHIKVASPGNLRAKHLMIICGGSGITPIYPVIKAIVDDPNDTTLVTLLYSNKTEQDILLKSELQALASDPRVKIYYTLSTAPAGWAGFTGTVTKEMIQKTMPAPGKDLFIWVCGPPGMDNAVEQQLKELKYPTDRQVIASKLGYLLKIILRSVFCCRNK